MHRIITYLLLLCGTLAIAQPSTPASASSTDQCLIGFYVRDSVAIRLPEATTHYAAIKTYEAELLNIRVRQIIVFDKYLSLRVGSAKTKKEKDAALTQFVALRNDSIKKEQAIAKERSLLLPSYKKVDHVADSIGKSRAMKQVRDVGDNSEMVCPSDQMLMTDITNDVAIGLHLKPKLVKIGLYNSDSLMLLMTGYKTLADSTASERFDLEMQLTEKRMPIDIKQTELDTMRKSWSRKQISNREKEIAALQDEYDTFRGYELYKLDVRDSVRTQGYRRKFRAALAASIKEYGCYRVYEIHDAQTEWTAKEAEFIDLNAPIAEKLRK